MATAMRAKGDGILTRWPWLRELRPTWWLARGAALGWLLSVWTGTGRAVLLPLLGAALSFWVGLALRRREPLRSAARATLATANVIAALTVLPMLAAYTSSYLGSEVEYLGEAYVPYPTAATANGEDLRNLYAYDAAGNRIDGVRLFDRAGQPGVIGPNLLNDGTFGDLPMRPEDGMPDIANDLFPLRWAGHDPWGSSQTGWVPPLVLAPVPGAAATAPPTPSTSMGPSATPTGGASPSPSPSGGVSPSPSP